MLNVVFSVWWLKPFWVAWFYVSSAVCSNPWLFFHIVTFVSVFLYLSCNLFQFPFNQSCACIWCDCVMWLAWCWWCHPHWWAEGKHSGSSSILSRAGLALTHIRITAFIPNPPLELAPVTFLELNPLRQVMKIHPFPIFNRDCYPWATTALWLLKLSSVVNMESGEEEKKVDAVSCQPWKWHQKLWSWKTFPQSDHWVRQSRSFMFSLNILTSSGFTDALHWRPFISCCFGYAATSVQLYPN